MDVRELEILGADVDRHWYYRSKARMLLGLLGGRRFDLVIDVGAGSGFFSRSLLASQVARRAICVDPAYAEDTTQSVQGGQISFVKQWSGPETPDLLLFMDVLEHVHAPLDVLASYVNRLRQGGLCVVTVPAFQFLWSGHDVFLGHVRRYTLAEIEGLLCAAGLTVLKGRYFFGVLFPVATALRLRDRWMLNRGHVEARSALKRARGVVNAALITLHDLERTLLFPLNRVAGLSAVCLTRKGSDIGS